MKTESKNAYEEKYINGYGIQYPEGHVIRIYEKILKYKMRITGEKQEKLLDFGCGNGTHAAYFSSKGFITYGVDISKKAIELCKHRMNDGENQYHCIEPNSSISHLFQNTKFDIIFSNQTLYYLPDNVLHDTLQEFSSLLKDDGIIIATMMGTKNQYYKYVNETYSNGLSKVELQGRLNETTYINFMTNEEHLAKTFNMFKSEYIGYYDLDLGNGEDSSHHYIYIGSKPKSKQF